jgi:Uma2 family endonuclease
MNAPILPAHWPQSKFTVAEIWALIERGLISPDAKFELLDGEVIPVSPKGPLHEEVRQAVVEWLAGSVAPPLTWMPETTLYLEETAFLEPDFVVFDKSVRVRDLKAHQVKLLIEVAHESWRYDTVEKAQRYSQHGVQEYWAIHAPSRVTRVHRGPGADGWAEVREIAAGESVVALSALRAPLRL